MVKLLFVQSLLSLPRLNLHQHHSSPTVFYLYLISDYPVPSTFLLVNYSRTPNVILVFNSVHLQSCGFHSHLAVVFLVAQVSRVPRL